MKKYIKLVLSVVAVGIVLVGCGSKNSSSNEDSEVKTVKLGVVGDDTRVWDDVAKRLKKKELT